MGILISLYPNDVLANGLCMSLNLDDAIVEDRFVFFYSHFIHILFTFHWFSYVLKTKADSSQSTN